MPFASALFGGGAALLGGVISGNAAEDAANTQANAANQATALQRQMFEQGRADLMPWQQAGGASLRELLWQMGLDPNVAMGAGGAAPGAGPLSPTPGTGGVTGTFGAGLNPISAMGPDQLAEMIAQAGGGVGGGDPLNILKRNLTGFAMPAPALPGTAPAAGGAPATAPFVGDPATRGQLLRPFDLAAFQADPGFQFRSQQGEEAINRAAAARGNFMSPATLKALSGFSQDMASDEFANAYNRYNQNLSNIYSRLTGISGSGENAAGRIAGLGAGFGTQAGENLIGAGNAAAAGGIGQAGAINQGIGSAINYGLLQRFLQPPTAPTDVGTIDPFGGVGAGFTGGPY